MSKTRENQCESIPPPGRRRFRLTMSLRIALVLVVSLALVLGWITGGAHARRRAVAAIRAAGGQVRYDDQARSVILNLGAKPGLEEWLLRHVGEDYFHDVFRIELAGTQVTDDGLACLRTLNR